MDGSTADAGVETEASNATREPSTLRDALVAGGAGLGWGEALAVIAALAVALERSSPDDAAPRAALAPDSVTLGPGGAASFTHGTRAGSGASPHDLRYMSPEQIDARPLDARSDLYVLGLILYEALAGAPPFAATSPRELMNLQCTAAPPPLPDRVRRELPRGVEVILGELLAKDPSERIASATALIERLTPFLAAAGPSAAPRPRRERSTASPRAPRLGRWLRDSQPMPNALVALAAVLLALAAAASTYVARASCAGHAPVDPPGSASRP